MASSNTRAKLSHLEDIQWKLTLFPKARKAAQEVPIEARIAGLEQRRAQLVEQKAGLDKKLAEIQARRVSSSNS